MKRASHLAALIAVLAWFGTQAATAEDWPQWRGPNRDGKAAGFQAPSSWPKELTQKWKVTVGDGAATPALADGKLYVHSREGGDEVLRCLDADTGKELWQAKYAAEPSTDPGGFAGPRSSPAVAEGKVVTIGARGRISCFDAESGKQLWSKDDFRAWPDFFASSSPLIVDGLCIAQLGGNDGAVVAYDLATGEEKWKEGGLPTGYSSPVLMTVADTKLVIAPVLDGIVALDLGSGEKLWEVFFEGGGRNYRAPTPIGAGDTLIYFDISPRAVQLSKQDGKIVAKEVWDNPEQRLDYNTPVLKQGLLFGLTGAAGAQAHHFFCFDIKEGETAWTEPAPRMGDSGGGAGRRPAGAGKAGQRPGGAKGFGQGGFRGGRGGGMRADAGYGSIVDAGSVLIALTPSSDLIFFEPSDKEFKKLASYKVADGGTYAHPVVSGNRIYIKDRDSVGMWAIE